MKDEFRVSNAMMLSGRQWIGLGVFAAVLVLSLPSLWERLEPLPGEAAARIPYQLSNDYWLFRRMVEEAARRDLIILLGDSVVWGQYVTSEHTLSNQLNRLAGRQRFANLGADGMHPAALAGLIRYYAQGLSGKSVVLHLNPLWLSSPRHDLSGEEEFRFNHPALVPQFSPRIPCYREEVSRRLGFVVERNLPFFQWTNHLQLAYVEQTNLPEWTLEHPYSIPERLLRPGLTEEDKRPRHRVSPEGAVPWNEQRIQQQDFAWVDPARSFQWASFQRAVDLLRSRGNRVFVLVGPFNEHLLTEEGRWGYLRILEGVAAWLRERGIDHDLPPALPSPLYADASHPLADGYRELAARIISRLSQ